MTEISINPTILMGALALIATLLVATIGFVNKFTNATTKSTTRAEERDASMQQSLTDILAAQRDLDLKVDSISNLGQQNSHDIASIKDSVAEIKGQVHNISSEVRDHALRLLKIEVRLDAPNPITNTNTIKEQA